MRKGTPLASRVAQGVSGPSSSCVWTPRVFADDAPPKQSPDSKTARPQHRERNNKGRARESKQKGAGNHGRVEGSDPAGLCHSHNEGSGEKGGGRSWAEGALSERA